MNTLSYLSLMVNSCSFLIAMGAISSFYKRENLISLLYWFVFAFLVVGQSIYIYLFRYYKQMGRRFIICFMKLIPSDIY